MTANRADDETSYAIIGAGPVGLLTALAVHRSRSGGDPTGDWDRDGGGPPPPSVVVYDRRPNLEQSLEESYPIGVTARGLRALRSICPEAAADVEASGVVVDSWDVHAGRRGRRVGTVPSGTTLGHTRYSVAEALRRRVAEAGIEVRFGHRLVGLDVRGRTLTFSAVGTGAGSDRRGDGRSVDEPREVAVDCRNSVVVAADGAGSAVRRLLLSAAAASSSSSSPSFRPLRSTVTPWGIHFRVLVMDGPRADGAAVPLSSSSHAIYNGVYCALIGPPRRRRWVVVPSAKETDDHARWFFLDSAVPPREAMDSLRRYVAKRVPPIADTEGFFTDEEIRAFFSRRAFTGSLVSLAPLHYPHTLGRVREKFGGGDTAAEAAGAAGEDDKDVNDDPWIVFLGDAAHSVFPATGEGLNSGLDDVLVFAETVLWPAHGRSAAVSFSSHEEHGSAVDLSAYTSARQPDVDALSHLAAEIVSGQTGPPEVRATKLLTTILFSVLRSVRLVGPSQAELRYGPSTARELLPYREVWRRHLRDTGLVRKFAGAIVYAVFFLRSLFRGREAHNKKDD